MQQSLDGTPSDRVRAAGAARWRESAKPRCPILFDSHAAGNCAQPDRTPRWRGGRYGTIGGSSVPDPPLPQSPPLLKRPERFWLGPILAFAGAFGFSAKAIFAKLTYAVSAIDALTLLTFRMIFSLPFFIVMMWFALRDATRERIARRDWIAIVWLGFIGYYLSSLLDFMGLQYISASLERLILFLNPTIVVLLSALVLRKPITRRTGLALALSYAGILLVFAHDLHLVQETAALLIGSGLVFASAISYALYLVGYGEIIRRVGATRFTACAMLASTVFVFLQFLLTRPLSALDQPYGFEDSDTAARPVPVSTSFEVRAGQ